MEIRGLLESGWKKLGVNNTYVGNFSEHDNLDGNIKRDIAIHYINPL